MCVGCVDTPARRCSTTFFVIFFARVRAITLCVMCTYISCPFNATVLPGARASQCRASFFLWYGLFAYTDAWIFFFHLFSGLQFVFIEKLGALFSPKRPWSGDWKMRVHALASIFFFVLFVCDNAIFAIDRVTSPFCVFINDIICRRLVIGWVKKTDSVRMFQKLRDPCIMISWWNDVLWGEI